MLLPARLERQARPGESRKTCQTEAIAERDLTAVCVHKNDDVAGAHHSDCRLVERDREPCAREPVSNVAPANPLVP